jgi:YD repeat-containing protein
VTQEQRRLDGRWYTTQSTYDGLDRVSTQTLPVGEALTRIYGQNGKLTSFSSSLGDTLVSGTQ